MSTPYNTVRDKQWKDFLNSILADLLMQSFVFLKFKKRRKINEKTPRLIFFF